MMRWAWIALCLLALCLPTSASTASASAPGVSSGWGHSLPSPNDHFSFFESILLDQGIGNYTGYSEHTYLNGSRTITGVLPNGTVSASYLDTWTWSNDTGSTQSGTSQGPFSFSAATFHYVQGTDNQTGYTNPFVWFYMNNTLPTGGTFYLLNTQMTVLDRSAPFAVPNALSNTGYAQTISAQGTGSYQRNDVYGRFTATYTWQAYFDPTTGYIVGYVYTETDTDGTGDGFTWTDTVTDTAASFALTPAVLPPAPNPNPGPSFGTILLVVLLIVVVLVVIVVVAARRRRSKSGATSMGAASLPRHSAPATPGTPTAWAPPAVQLLPQNQPAVQQIVIKETVKVPCRYCGTLIDSTATVCPQCGAPRT